MGNKIENLSELRAVTLRRDTIAKSFAMAKGLAVGTPVIFERSPSDTVITETTSEPWKLGHGQWVVKVRGVTGGVGCDFLKRFKTI